MSEFKFACPNCQQHIQATSEYAGVEINCPICQAAIVVPAPPEAAPASQAPGGGKGKLSKAPSTVHQPATSPVMQQQVIRKSKKPNVKLYAGLAVGAAVIVAGVLLAPKVMDKVQEHKEAVAAAQAATNPPPPPPEPTAAELLQKLGAAYKGFTSYRAHGESVADLDLSQISPAFKKPLHSTAKISILFARGGRYRIDWERQFENRPFKGDISSTGKGDFVGRSKVKNREVAMDTAMATSATLAPALGELFFESTNSIAKTMKDYSEAPSENIGGQKCYVLTGKVPVQDLPEQLTVWLDKKDFLVNQLKLTFSGDGQVNPAITAGMNATQKAQIIAESKTKGTIVETYTGIDEDFDVQPDEFKKGVNVNGPVAQRAPHPPHPRQK